MSLQRIELNDSPGQEFSTIIQGVRVVFRFRYNTVSNRFYFDVSAGDSFVIQGRTLQSNVDLFTTLGDTDVDLGSLFCVDIDDKDREPTIENISEGAVRIFLQTGA